MKRIPIALTWLRIALIPVFVLVYLWPAPAARPLAALIFLLAGITDWLDGYLARRMGVTTKFGAFLDPVADKLLVATALVLLTFTANGGILVALAAAIIIGREITISALREWMAELGARAHVSVSRTGKFKTIAQIVALILMIFRDSLFGLPIYLVGQVFLAVAAVLTLWSMWVYLRSAWPYLSARDNH